MAKKKEKVPEPTPKKIGERPDFIYFKKYVKDLDTFEVVLSHKDEIVLSEQDEYISGDNNLELCVKMANLYAIENELTFNY